MPKTIFLDCNNDLLPLWQRVLKPGGPEIAVNMVPVPTGTVPGLLAGYDTCIDDSTFFPRELLQQCNGLRHIVFLGTGASSFIDVKAAAELGIKVSTIKGYGDTTVAEHCMALLFAAARSVATMDRLVRAGGWRQYEGVQLLGKTLGIVGYGGIGREVARIASGIGMNVVAWNRSPIADATVPMAPLDEVLARADILSLHLGLNDETTGFLNAERMDRMKQGAILVNTARAAVVDQKALVERLRSGRIRHAAIDVFVPEPPHADDPLLALENVTLTAHAGFLTPEASMTMLSRAIELAAAGY
jgi:D-3-phosphoglycerate dehydrogenase